VPPRLKAGGRDRVGVEMAGEGIEGGAKGLLDLGVEGGRINKGVLGSGEKGERTRTRWVALRFAVGRIGCVVVVVVVVVVVAAAAAAVAGEAVAAAVAGAAIPPVVAVVAAVAAAVGGMLVAGVDTLPMHAFRDSQD
jgi:hypothetical protein